MAAPVLRVIFSAEPVLDDRKCIVVHFQKPAHEQLIRAIGAQTQNAIDIIAWLSILINKSPVMIPNYIHQGKVCTLYLFDPRHMNTKMLKTHFAGELGLVTDEQIAEYIASL